MVSKRFIFSLLLILLVIVVAFVLLTAPLNEWFRLQTSTSALEGNYDVGVAFPNLQFLTPVGLYSANDGTDRLFVVEQQGIIYVFENTPSVSSRDVFLDITDRVLFGGEQGLLGLAFSPDFANNGQFYLNYVADNPRRTIISRFSVSQTNPHQANPQSEFILMEVLQPTAIHNGGQIAFGPDGYLYIAFGDGGPGNDPSGRGQSLETLLGKILRIDVSGINYSIPSDNPFIGNTFGYREEIYAYGFRNPWRFSFDFETGRLWVGDVGQARIEEIDIVEKGKNYGWNLMEGSLPFELGSADPSGFELPVWEYSRDLGISVTGGFVYRGSILRELVGQYIYGDFGSGRIWALDYVANGDVANSELVDTNLSLLSFGVDQNNELYVCALDGRIYQLHVIEPTPPDIGVPIQMPQEPLPDQEVTVMVNVTDAVSGIKEVVLSYSNDTVWINITMTYFEGDTYSATIPPMPDQTVVRYRIIATDNANNTTIEDNLGTAYTYTVVPESPSVLALAGLLIAVSFIAVKIRKRNSFMDYRPTV